MVPTSRYLASIALTASGNMSWVAIQMWLGWPRGAHLPAPSRADWTAVRAKSEAQNMQLASGWARRALTEPERNRSGFHSVGTWTMVLTTPDLSVVACQALERLT